MNTILNRNNRSKAFLAITVATISLVFVSGLLGESVFAQQANQQTLNGATGTVVRVRLVSTPIPTSKEANGVGSIPVPDLVEVGVQVANGEVYVALANRARQPRLGASVTLVSAGSFLRVAD